MSATYDSMKGQPSRLQASQAAAIAKLDATRETNSARGLGRPAPSSFAGRPAGSAATRPQLDFITSLIAKHDALNLPASSAALAIMEAVGSVLPQRQASAVIDALRAQLERAVAARLAAPKLAAPKVDAPAPKRDDFADVPAGYYAISVQRETGDAGPVLRFLRVSRTASGYVNVQTQRGDDLLDRQNWVTAKHNLERIREAGPLKSAQLYATEIGRCYVCGRTLTDEASRASGIGPVCATKSGF